jgi:ABC-type transporter Mla subunit MlaD
VRWAKGSTLAAVLVALATGCGGGGSDDEGTVPAEEWAGSVCTSVSRWTGSLEDATNRLRSPEQITVNGFKGAVNSAVEATQQFVDEIGALGAPSTDAGAEAKSELDQLSSTLEDDANELSEQVDSASDGLSGLLTKLSAITSTLSDMSSAVGTTFDRISNLDGAAELEAAFQDADSCKELGSTR